jgi:hypothetical protein
VCALFEIIYINKFDNGGFLSKKNSLFPPKDLLVGGSLAASEYPQDVTVSAAKTKKKDIKMAVKKMRE